VKVTLTSDADGVYEWEFLGIANDRPNDRPNENVEEVVKGVQSGDQSGDQQEEYKAVDGMKMDTRVSDVSIMLAWKRFKRSYRLFISEVQHSSRHDFELIRRASW
jgi:hypothetical protein